MKKKIKKRPEPRVIIIRQDSYQMDLFEINEDNVVKIEQSFKKKENKNVNGQHID